MSVGSISLGLVLCGSVFATLFTTSVVAAVQEDNNAVIDNAAYRAKIDSLFKEAMKKRDGGDAFASIAMFQSILSNQPSLHRARLEMAVALYQSYKFDEAVKQAQIVLDDPKTPPKVRASILAFMGQVKRDAGKTGGTAKRKWRFPVEFGYLYDTNANVGPSSSVVDSVPLGEGSTKRSSSGAVISLGADHTWQSSKLLNFGESKATLLWQSGAQLYHRGYFGVDDNNLTVFSIRTGPGFIGVGRKFRANFTVQEDFLNYGGKQYGNFTHLLPSFNIHWGRGSLETTIDGVFSERNYTQDLYQGRDSIYLAPRIYVGDAFFRGKLSAQAGFQYFNENADDDQYSTEGTYIFANINWKCMTRTNIYLGYGQRDESHDKVTPSFEALGPRDETEHQYKIGANYTFKGQKILDKWRVNLETIVNNRDSNLALYDYTRAQTTLTLSRTF